MTGKGEMCLGFIELERFGNYPMTPIFYKALGPILVKQWDYWRQMHDNSGELFLKIIIKYTYIHRTDHVHKNHQHNRRGV